MQTLAKREEVSDTVRRWAARPDAADVARAAGWDAPDCLAAMAVMEIHGIAPLLHGAFRSSGLLERLPHRLQTYLRARHEANADRATRLLRLRERLHETLGRRRIPWMPLKGAVLLGDYWPDPALRPTADIDILIRPRSQRALTDALTELGFQEKQGTERHRSFAPVREPAAASPDDTRGPGRISIDVHERVAFRTLSVTTDITNVLWKEDATGEDVQPRALLPAPLLFHVLCHLGQHLFDKAARMIQLCDIAHVVERLQGVEWDRNIEWARSFGVERMLYAALAVSRSSVDLPVPQHVLDSLSEGTPPSLCALLDSTSLADHSFETVDVPFRAQMLWLHPGTERRRAVRRLLFPGPSAACDRHPRVAFAAGTAAACASCAVDPFVWPLLRAFSLTGLARSRRRMLKKMYRMLEDVPRD